MPQNPMILATKAISGDVCIFDITKHPSIPRDSSSHPNILCKGHTKEGYGLSWSSCQEGYLASGSDDKKVCIWNIPRGCTSSVLSPVHEYTEQQDIVEVIE